MEKNINSTPNKILKSLMYLINKVSNSVKDGDGDAYDEMNRRIIEMIIVDDIALKDD